MDSLSYVSPTEWLSAALFLVTAILLLVATRSRRGLVASSTAIASLLTVTAANACLIMSYAGEPVIAYDPPGPIKRKKGGERGYFEFAEEEGEGGAASDGKGSGLMLSSWLGGGEPTGVRARGWYDCNECPEMVMVPAGFFRMGASDADPAADEAERPGRFIGFGTPFAIGRYEVTVREYQAFASAAGRDMPVCPGAPVVASHPLQPVTCVSLAEAEAYASWLNRRSGRRFRLPTEAEWEYAARGGPVDSATIAPATLPGADRLAPVGLSLPSRLGLYDIAGNAAERVAGCWRASPSELPADGRVVASTGECSRSVLRGADPIGRLTARRPIDPSARLPTVGFRVARDVR
ncbi:MAG: formylglycine-generating enzyme family protein [Hyphomicrobiaceae bacterium]